MTCQLCTERLFSMLHCDKSNIASIVMQRDIMLAIAWRKHCAPCVWWHTAGVQHSTNAVLV